jgi:hypothetical protein
MVLIYSQHLPGKQRGNDYKRGILSLLASGGFAWWLLLSSATTI